MFFIKFLIYFYISTLTSSLRTSSLRPRRTSFTKKGHGILFLVPSDILCYKEKTISALWLLWRMTANRPVTFPSPGGRRPFPFKTSITQPRGRPPTAAAPPSWTIAKALKAAPFTALDGAFLRNGTSWRRPPDEGKWTTLAALFCRDPPLLPFIFRRLLFHATDGTRTLPGHDTLSPPVGNANGVPPRLNVLKIADAVFPSFSLRRRVRRGTHRMLSLLRTSWTGVSLPVKTLILLHIT